MVSHENRALLTDLYQLTMGAVYHDSGKNDVATFDLFVRKLPEGWGYFIANGIEDAADIAEQFHFSKSDIDYLRSQDMFSEGYLSRLSQLRFTGSIDAMREGTPFTPNTPVLRVTAPRIEAQLLETVLLNAINPQTLVASKASRIVNAASPAGVVDFGLRRAQEADAGMTGARAAYIAGAVATSNVLAGKKYDIPISGTLAHSLIMSFDTELEAFRAYASTFPDKPTLLIDTYDTREGARNAIIVGNELRAAGNELGAVRIDSNDLAAEAIDVRAILDDAGFPDVKIIASNDLNEYKIRDLRFEKAPFDGYGVGTEMITGKPIAAISGVYKLVQDGDGPKIKLSKGKVSLPGIKQVYRTTDTFGVYEEDIIALETETMRGTPLLQPLMRNGRRVTERPSARAVREYSLAEVAKLPSGARELHAMPYTASVSQGVAELVEELTQRHTPTLAER
jgi:nicotinate phosphoribosyltransferase